MAKQTISLGTAPTGAGGDTPRSAFSKVIANTDELYDLATAAQSTATTAKEGVDVINSGQRTIEQGGTGASTAFQACLNLGAITRGDSSDTSGTTFRGGGLPAFSATTDANNRTGPLMISNGSNEAACAAISLIREGAFGVHFGLNTDNNLSVGGWSMGANAHVIYHAGNTTRAADGTLKAI